jgi:pimeloyl-ACP methyl ester carboxylesterase
MKTPRSLVSIWKWAAIFCLLVLGNSLCADDTSKVILRVPAGQDGGIKSHQLLAALGTMSGVSPDLRGVPNETIRFNQRQKKLVVLGMQLVGIDVEFEPTELVIVFERAKLPADDSAARLIRSTFGVDEVDWSHYGLTDVTGDLADIDSALVVLVHGFEATSSTMQSMAEMMNRRGYQACFFEYPNDAPIGKSGELLVRELKQVQEQNRDLRVVLVAHSMGGLVCRHALEVAGRDEIRNVTDLVMLGTPHQGADLVHLYPMLFLLTDVIPNISQLKRVGLDGYSQAARDLEPGSKFLTQLNASRRGKRVRYHVAVGTVAPIPRGKFQPMLEKLDNWMEGRGNSASQRQSVMATLEKAAALEDGSGDGVVAASSARLRGVENARRFRLNHNQLISAGKSSTEQRQILQWLFDSIRSQD